MSLSYKNPPEMRDGLLYDDWKKELEIWCSFTDLEAKRQGPAIFLTLKGKARETVLAEVKPATLKTDDGVEKITIALDKLYKKNKSESAFTAFENFIKFKRPNSMSIKDYCIEFNLRLCKIKGHSMELPDGVLAYYLLSCANLTEDQTSLCRATCVNLTYDDMKTQIERISVPNESASSGFANIQVAAEHQYVAQYSQYHDDSHYQYEEEHTGEEEEEVEVEDTYYSRPGAWSGTAYQSRSGRSPSTYTAKKQKNPLDEFGNPTPCRFCKSIYHWVDQCPDAPMTLRSAGPSRAKSSSYFKQRSRSRWWW
jgi:hypothetical protein